MKKKISLDELKAEWAAKQEEHDKRVETLMIVEGAIRDVREQTAQEKIAEFWKGERGNGNFQDWQLKKADWEEAKSSLKVYARQMNYKSAKDYPDHPYAKFATPSCDNVNLDGETNCHICGQKHGRYDMKKGWIPAHKGPMQGAPGRNEVAVRLNNFSKEPHRAWAINKKLGNGKCVIPVDNTHKGVGSDHSSDGTDCSDVLYSDEDWGASESKQEEPVRETIHRVATNNKEEARMRLMALYPEMYED